MDCALSIYKYSCKAKRFENLYLTSYYESYELSNVARLNRCESIEEMINNNLSPNGLIDINTVIYSTLEDMYKELTSDEIIMYCKCIIANLLSKLSYKRDFSWSDFNKSFSHSVTFENIFYVTKLMIEKYNKFIDHSDITYIFDFDLEMFELYGLDWYNELFEKIFHPSYYYEVTYEDLSVADDNILRAEKNALLSINLFLNPNGLISDDLVFVELYNSTKYVNFTSLSELRTVNALLCEDD